jgi:surface antigen
MGINPCSNSCFVICSNATFQIRPCACNYEQRAGLGSVVPIREGNVVKTTTIVRGGRRRSLFLALLLAPLAAAGLVTVSAIPALADTSLCSNNAYSTCTSAGYTDHGYSAHSGTSYWGAYTGHNCTNYVAYVEKVVNGATTSTSGNATDWDNNAPSGSVNTTPGLGSVAQWEAGYHGADSSGHVAYVEAVNSDGSITVSEDNWQYGPFSWRTITPGGGYWPSHFVHFADFSSPPATSPPTTPNMDPVRLQGDFTGDGKADIVAVTPRSYNNPSGINLSMLSSNGSSISNIGLWYYNTGVDIVTSRYVTGDFTGDGKADIAIITPRGGGGINVTVLVSTGSGFTSSLWFYDTGVDPTSTRYVAGDFTGDGKADIVAITARSSSTPTGVNLSVLQSSGSAFSNIGAWFSDNGVDINTARWVAGDFDNDGKTDVAAITPRGGGGINISMLSNTGSAFTNVGLWFYDNGVNYVNTRYVAGDFNGDGKPDIATITARGTSTPSGVNISVLQDTGTAFSNSGLWFYDTGVDISTSRYIVGDFNNDGKADITVMTPRGNPGVNASMLQSNGSSLPNVGLWWYDNGVDINNSQWG